MAKVSLWTTGAGDGLPDGSKISDYPKWKTWSHRRWAWEFLRRNPNFINDCKKVDAGLIQEDTVCATFHIQEFKHFTEKFRSKSCPLPVFPLNRRKFAANVMAVGMVTREKAIFKLKPGEVVFKYDLNQERYVAGSLQSQIELVAKRLHELKEAYFSSNNYKSPKSTKPQSQSFIKSVRLLDATRESESVATGYKAAFPQMCGNLSQDGIRKQAESELRTARSYALAGYLQIAAGRGAKSK